METAQQISGRNGSYGNHPEAGGRLRFATDRRETHAFGRTDWQAGHTPRSLQVQHALHCPARSRCSGGWGA